MARYRQGDRISDLLLQRGDIAAQGALRSGDIWGGTVAGLGQQAAGFLEQRQAKKEHEAALAQEEEQARQAKFLEAEQAQADQVAKEEKGARLDAMMTDPQSRENPDAVLASLINDYGEPQGNRIFKSWQDAGAPEEEQDPAKAQAALENHAEAWRNGDEVFRERAAPVYTKLLQDAGYEVQGPEDLDSFAGAVAEKQQGPEWGSDEWYSQQDEPTQAAYRQDVAERAAAGRAPRVEGEPKYVTVTRKADGQRVRIPESEWNADGGEAFTDMKPAAGGGARGGQRQQAQKSVNAIVGAPSTGDPEVDDPESLYSLVMGNTLPGNVGLLAAVGGVGASLQKWTKTGYNRADVELYESQKEGYIPLIARAVGHTGVLTEKDVERTERLLPTLSGPNADTRAIALRKLDRLRRIMAGEEEVKATFYEPQDGSWPPSSGGGEWSLEVQQLAEEYGLEE